MGVVVLAGWWIRSARIVQILPTTAPMQFNTALAFVATGIAFWLLQRRRSRVLVAFAAIPFVLGLLTLLEYVFQWDLGIDRLFVEPFTVVQTSHPGRPSPIAAALFVLLAVTLVISRFSNRWVRLVVACLASVIGSLAACALLGYLVHVEAGYAIGQLTRVAVHTAFLFLLLALGLLAWLWKEEGRGLPSWLPLPVAVGGITGSLFVWESLHLQEKITLQQTFERSAANLEGAIVSEIRKITFDFERMASRQAVFGDSDRLWELDAHNFLQQLPGLISIESLDPDATVRRAYPVEGNQASRNRRAGGDPRWTRVLEEVRSTGQSQVTEIMPLVQGGRGFFIISPVRSADRFLGFLEGAFVVGPFMERVHTGPLNGLRFAILAGGSAVYEAPGERTVRGVDYKKTIHVGTQSWELHLLATEPALASIRTRHPELVLVLGLTMTLLLGFTIRYGISAYDRAEQLKRSERALEAGRDAALELARLKSEFLANMSHEIRTPMNAIIGMTGLLRDAPMGPQEHDFVETIRSSGETLMTVINEILDFSKLESGKVSLELSEYEVQNMVESVADLVADTALRKQLELVISVSPDVPRLLKGDSARLKQVILNLANNAIKFTEAGDVVVRVTREREGESDVVLLFEVSDTGIGISPEGQKRLFQAFSQAEVSTTRRFGGTGLGLVISKRLIEMMGGEIGVRSEPGRGSTFWFRVRQEKPAQAREAPPARFKGLRILVVDERLAQAEAVASELRNQGAESSLETTALRGFQTLLDAARRERPFELVIADCQMPEVDGLAFVRMIRNEPAIRKTRVILLASYLAPLTPEKNEALEIAGVVPKPVKAGRLIQTIEEVITGAAAPSASRGTHRDFPTVQELGIKSCRILLAEDNLVNQKVALLQLRKIGCTVDTALNGSEAVTAASQRPYDVILMDCEMPEMDGFEATRAIRSREGPCKKAKIIAMTAHAMEGDRERCLMHGMDDYLSKPVRTELLYDMLIGYLQSRGPAKSRTGNQ